MKVDISDRTTDVLLLHPCGRDGGGGDDHGHWAYINEGDHLECQVFIFETRFCYPVVIRRPLPKLDFLKPMQLVLGLNSNASPNGRIYCAPLQMREDTKLRKKRHRKYMSATPQHPERSPSCAKDSPDSRWVLFGFTSEYFG